jgi:hypothetical protein
MSRLSHRLVIILAGLLAAASPAVGSAWGQAERRPPPAQEPQRHPNPPPARQAKPRQPAQQPGDRDRDRDRARQPRAVPVRPPAVTGRVFVRGRFYDPYVWSYPWWPYGVSPYWYAPLYDQRAWLQIKATPKDAAVYVDGYYAGLVDEFDGALQGLPLPEGGYRIVLHREGYRSAEHGIYLRRGATFTLRDALTRLGPGERQQPPPVPERPPAFTARQPSQATAILDIRVTPEDASIVVDGRPWLSDRGHVLVAVTPGPHLLRVIAPGYGSFMLELELEAGHTLPLDVTLVPASDE